MSNKTLTKLPVCCIHCSYRWETTSQACSVSCPKCGLKTPLRARPDPVPMKTPEGLKKATKARLGAIPEGATLRGQLLSQAVGRVIQTETIVVPTIKHTVRPLIAREVIGNCQYCQKPLRERPQLNVMVNEKKRLHSTCFLEKIICENNGDLSACSHLWNVPMEALQARAQRLRQLGKMPETTLV